MESKPICNYFSTYFNIFVLVDRWRFALGRPEPQTSRHLATREETTFAKMPPRRNVIQPLVRFRNVGANQRKVFLENDR
jgi:hypothetical protein